MPARRAAPRRTHIVSSRCQSLCCARSTHPAFGERARRFLIQLVCRQPPLLVALFAESKLIIESSLNYKEGKKDVSTGSSSTSQIHRFFGTTSAAVNFWRRGSRNLHDENIHALRTLPLACTEQLGYAKRILHKGRKSPISSRGIQRETWQLVPCLQITGILP